MKRFLRIPLTIVFCGGELLGGFLFNTTTMKKLSHKEFLKRLYARNKYYREGYFKIIGKYKTMRSKIKFEDKYGEGEISTTLLLSDYKPTIECALDKTSYFKNIVLEYNVNYQNNLFEIIGEYRGSQNRVLVKTEFGECMVIADSLIRGALPTVETAINKTEYFKNKIPYYLKNTLDLSKIIYKNDKTQVIVGCEKHGVFTKLPSQLLRGETCPKCNLENRRLRGDFNSIGWSKSTWKEVANNSENFESFKVYIIRCWNENEEFYKIGRTFTTVQKRFNTPSEMPYKYDIVDIFTGDSAIMYDLEIELQKQHGEFRYRPLKRFAGEYECFSEINLEIIKNLLSLYKIKN